MWGYPRCGLGAVGAVLEPFCGHLSPKLDRVPCKLTFEIPPRRTLGGECHHPAHCRGTTTPAGHTTDTCLVFFSIHPLKITRMVDIRLPGKGDSNSHGARPVHQKHRWIRTSRLSIKNSLSLSPLKTPPAQVLNPLSHAPRKPSRTPLTPGGLWVPGRTGGHDRRETAILRSTLTPNTVELIPARGALFP